MNRKEAANLLPIIQAFAEGKNIEYRSKGFNEDWKKVTQIPELSFESFEYRIKPEPKFRPFKDAEECWQEMLKHQPFGWVKLKATRKYFIYKAIGDFFAAVGLNDRPTNYDELFEEYIFADGVPFGVKTEE